MSSGGFPDRFQLLVAAASRVIQGKTEVIQQAFVCLLAGGHLLLEDVPGVGKTSLARAIASTVDLQWGRIQFTPDLLPSDVTGVSIFNQKTGDFEFRPGPVFNNIVIGDEINRASPKTQSALLEVMEERTVTSDRTTHSVPNPFMVVATQNPIDLEGTYQLPEAQMDRFLMRLSLGYPSADAERDVISTHVDGDVLDSSSPVLGLDDLLAMMQSIKRIEVSLAAKDYAVALANFTRSAPEVRLGVSPRGSLALIRAARVVAAATDRPFITSDDLKDLAPSVLTHRIMLTPEAELQGLTALDLVSRAISTVPVPRSRS
jgi:MoxR-like ATPase